ncbi:MAG: TonB-dependent receptor [Hyphomonadaceae bacterium]|nr:TonB-dependent receptor [Hyphomonadaceae bacterium]
MANFLHSQMLHAALGLGVSALALALPANAQTPEADAENRLGTVTVTAQKVEENIQDVPISITTVSDEKLTNLKASGADVRFLSARVPSVIAESSFGRTFPRFYIRGFGNTDFDLNASQPISLVYDGVPYENPILKGYPVFDLEAIEVLRGPQGTLFGRNAPGGVIKFDSVKPGDEFGGYGRGSWGTFNTVDTEGAVNFRVDDNLAVRVSGIYQSRDDYVDNAFTGESDQYEGFEELAGRVQLLFTPFDNDFSALLNVHGRDSEGSARLFRANIIDVGSNGVGSNFDRDTVQFDGLNMLDQTAWGVTLTLEKSLSESVDLTYIFGRETAEVFSRGDIDGGFGAAFLGEGNFGPGFIPFPSETGGGVDDLTQTTHEVRFAFDGGGPLRGQAGLFVFEENIEIRSVSFDSLSPDRPQNGLAYRQQDTNAFGIFASLSYDITDKLTVSGGARFTDDEKDFTAERVQSSIGTGPIGPLSESISSDEVSWDLSATYAATDDLNVYGRIAKGYRAPSVQGRLAFGDTLSSADAETVISYEAGVKSELFDNRLRANTGVYFYEISDQQLTIVGGLDNTVALFNADTGEGYGFEADIEAIPFENLLLTAGVSYNHTEIKDDVLIAPGCGAPCTILDPAVTDDMGNLLGYNISGNSFPNAPEWIGNVTARYAIPAPNGEFYAYTDWAYKGDTNFFLYESAEFGQDGYWEGGLRIGYASDLGYDVSVFGRNITDEEALTGGIDFNNLTGFVNEPQTFGVELAFDF